MSVVFILHEKDECSCCTWIVTQGIFNLKQIRHPRQLPMAEVWMVWLTLLGKDQATSSAGSNEETQRHPCKSRPAGGVGHRGPSCLIQNPQQLCDCVPRHCSRLACRVIALFLLSMSIKGNKGRLWGAGEEDKLFAYVLLPSLLQRNFCSSIVEPSKVDICNPGF